MKRTLALLVPAVVSAVLVIAAVAVAASSPTVTTGTHSHVTDTTAVLHGTVNPNGSATTYYFQWGLTTAYGVQSVAHSAGHGTKADGGQHDRDRADPRTRYHYRLVATNAAGTDDWRGPHLHDRRQSAAGREHRTGHPGEQERGHGDRGWSARTSRPRRYYFQYGTSTSYGSQTIPATVPAGHRAGHRGDRDHGPRGAARSSTTGSSRCTAIRAPQPGATRRS